MIKISSGSEWKVTIHDSINMLEGNLKTKKSENWFFPTGFTLFFGAHSTVNDFNMNRNICLRLKNMCRKIMTFSQNSTSALRLNKMKNLYEVLEKGNMNWHFDSHEMIYWNKTDFAQSRKKLFKGISYSAHRYFRMSNANRKRYKKQIERVIFSFLRNQQIFNKFSFKITRKRHINYQII